MRWKSFPQIHFIRNSRVELCRNSGMVAEGCAHGEPVRALYCHRCLKFRLKDFHL